MVKILIYLFLIVSFLANVCFAVYGGSEEKIQSVVKLILVEDQKICTGTIIQTDPLVILTAAHCLVIQNKKKRKLFAVRISSEKLNLNPLIKRVIIDGKSALSFIHPDYLQNGKVNGEVDIGLLVINNRLEDVSKSSISFNDVPDFERVKFCGFGKTSKNYASQDGRYLGMYSLCGENRLTTFKEREEVSHNINAKLQLKKILDRNVKYTLFRQDMFDGYIKEVSFINSGDSGGPLFFKKELIGVSSGVSYNTIENAFNLAEHLVPSSEDGKLIIASSFVKLSFVRQWLEKTLIEVNTIF